MRESSTSGASAHAWCWGSLIRRKGSLSSVRWSVGATRCFKEKDSVTVRFRKPAPWHMYSGRPEPFGHRDQFCGRHFFAGLGWGGDGFRRIQAHDLIILPLIWQEVVLRRWGAAAHTDEASLARRPLTSVVRPSSQQATDCYLFVAQGLGTPVGQDVWDRGSLGSNLSSPEAVAGVQRRAANSNVGSG